VVDGVKRNVDVAVVEVLERLVRCCVDLKWLMMMILEGVVVDSLLLMRQL